MADAVVETRNLTKFFGPHRGIEGVSIAVRPGEVYGLLGPNVAGKSTAIRLLLGLIKPTAGGSSLFGSDSWSRREQAHARIGMLPSEFAYEDSLTGREMLQFFARLRGVDTSAFANELAERLQADLDRPQKDLSRGNRQKIGLIQALAHKPDLAIMDEPTTGLDPLMREEFIKLVAEIRAEGRTVLLSSHYMAEVEQCCDRVAMIREGELLEVETVSSLLARAPKHVRIVFAGAADPEPFAALPGVSDMRADGRAVEFQVKGHIDAVVAETAKHAIVDFVSERPSLEHTFVQLYRDGGEL